MERNCHYRPKACHREKKDCHCPKKCEKTYTNDPVPLIYLPDLTNFDDVISLILLIKAPNIDLRLIGINYGFDDIGPSINNTFNLLSWFGDNETPVVRGAYFAPQEIEAGPYPTFAQAGDPSGENPVRQGIVAQPLFNMFVPPLWKENGSTIYGTVGKIPQNKNPDRQYSVFKPTPAKPFIPIEAYIAEALTEVAAEGKKAIIFNTGSNTDLAKFFDTYGTSYDSLIDRIIIMGGGFKNISPLFNPGYDVDRNAQRWAGNIFAERLFYLSGPNSFINSQPNPPPGYNVTQADWDAKPPFQTMQEYNIFLDPEGAQKVFDHIFNNKVNAQLIPTDATDPILIADGLDPLKNSPTPEGQYVYSIIQNMKKFEGADFDFIVRLWDILAALTYLNPEIVEQTVKAKVDVHQLDSIDNLKKIACVNPIINPYNVLQYDAYIGQTTYVEDANSSLTIVTKINREKALAAIINRLNAKLNTACKPLNF